MRSPAARKACEQGKRARRLSKACRSKSSKIGISATQQNENANRNNETGVPVTDQDAHTSNNDADEAPNKNARVLAAWSHVENAIGSKERALRVTALGLWLAWFWSAFGFGLCNPAFDRESAPWCVAAALVAACLVFAACARKPAVLQLGGKKSAIVGIAAVAAICSALLPLSDALGLVHPLTAGAICACGACGAWLLACCAQSEAALDPKDNFIAFLAAWLLATVLYMGATSLTGLFAAALFGAMPLACGVCLAIAGIPDTPQAAPASPLAPEEARMSRIELLIGIAVFFFTIGFVRSSGLAQATGPANFHIGASSAAALFALYAIFGIVYALRGHMTLPFIRTCYAFASLGLAFATMTMALTDTGGAAVRTLTDIAYLALLPAVWCAAGAGASIHERTAGNAFGSVLGTIAASSAAGWLTQCAVAAVYAQHDVITTLLLGLGFLCFAYFMFGFPITSFSSYLMRPEDRSPELAIAEGAPEQAAEQHRGMTFREGVNALADAAALSRREREVLLLLAKGISNERIAEELVISYHTVRAHVRNIYGKLEVHNRQELLERIEDVRREGHEESTSGR